MSRTTRNPAPRYNKNYDVSETVWRWNGAFFVGYNREERYRIRSSRDWKHAKSILPKDDYAHLRKLDGDCGLKFYLNRSLPKFFRNMSHREIRQVWQRERYRFFKDPSHEVIVDNRAREQFEYW